MPSKITPPQAQEHIDPAKRAGMPPYRVVAAGGAQGAGTTGKQGIGVNTPSAAAVAAATVGFAREVHIPNGGIFAPGAMSVIVAAGLPSMMGRGATTIKVDGARPNEHCIIAPAVTQGLPMIALFDGCASCWPAHVSTFTTGHRRGQGLPGGGHKADDFAVALFPTPRRGQQIGVVQRGIQVTDTDIVQKGFSAGSLSKGG